MVNYLVFDSLSEAVSAEAQISQEMGYPKVGVNAATGQPSPSAQTTDYWATPEQILDGRWVLPSPDGTGTASQIEWWGEATP